MPAIQTEELRRVVGSSPVPDAWHHTLSQPLIARVAGSCGRSPSPIPVTVGAGHARDPKPRTSPGGKKDGVLTDSHDLIVRK